MLKKTKGFSTTPNHILNDPNLSFSAKGLYAYISGKPDGWSFSREGITTQTKDGRTAVSSSIAELEKAGYLKREQKKDGNLFSSSVYILAYDAFDFELEGDKKRNNQMARFTSADFKTAQTATVKNVSYSNIDISNKEISNKDKEVYIVDFENLVEYANSKLQSKKKLRGGKKDISAFSARLKQGYTIEDMRRVIDNVTSTPYHIENNFQYVTMEFLTRQNTIEKYNIVKNNKEVPDYIKFNLELNAKAKNNQQ